MTTRADFHEIVHHAYRDLCMVRDIQRVRRLMWLDEHDLWVTSTGRLVNRTFFGAFKPADIHRLVHQGYLAHFTRNDARFVEVTGTGLEAVALLEQVERDAAASSDRWIRDFWKLTTATT